ncbi:MAG: glycosyltransferase family 39 protein [Pirellulales bacterium]|nr:glycosyltransferase family 39 protein [Pirellulales bacterium]
MGLLLPFQPAEPDYPNHLASPGPERLRPPPTGWLLAALVLLCLVPRAMMALRIPSVCPDGVFYIHAAKALASGEPRMAFRDIDLNVYPVVLAALHQMGLDWELAAALWGVTISSLVVLPLWGWVRRQFDDRVALLACMLYIVHPKFIEWSPEMMRDSTFWLLFASTIYFLWRAVTEIRLRFFIAAGATIVLAALTRVEGLFLLIPLALWTFWRWRALASTKQGAIAGLSSSAGGSLTANAAGQAGSGTRRALGSARRKLLLGAAMCVLLFPALLLLVNVVWLNGRYGWTLVRLEPLERAQTWLAHLFSQAPDAGGDSRTDMTLLHMAWVFFPTMTRGLSPLFALLMFGGLWGWRRVWARRDHQPLFYVALAIMCGIWIHLWYGRDICPRYALPIVLMASPFAALGLLGLVDSLTLIAERFRWRIGKDAIAVVVFGAVFVAGLTDAMTCNRSYFAGRRTAVAVGRWVRREFVRPVVVGPLGLTHIVSFYADGASYRSFRCDAKDEFILKMIGDRPAADVAIFRPAKELTARRCAALVDRLRSLGMAPLRRDAMPTDEPGFVIMVRGDRKDLAEKTE